MTDSITIIDNRNGNSIEVPLVDGGVDAKEWSKLLPGIWFYDPSFGATASTSSGITDGASAVVLVSEDELRRRTLKPLARVIDCGIAGVDPKIMGIGPVPAVKKFLTRTGMKLDQFDLVEINEAFAVQVLACLRDLPIDLEKVNVNGGAIALGHPIGCTGSRIVTTLVHEMQKRKVRYGLATLCISGGMGIALGLERL